MRISDWSSDVCSSDLPQHCRAIERDGLSYANGGAPPGERRPTEIGLEDVDLQHVRPATEGSAQRELRHGQAVGQQQIGRAACRERVCKYVYISVVAVSLKNKTSNRH